MRTTFNHPIALAFATAALASGSVLSQTVATAEADSTPPTPAEIHNACVQEVTQLERDEIVLQEFDAVEHPTKSRAFASFTMRSAQYGLMGYSYDNDANSQDCNGLASFTTTLKLKVGDYAAKVPNIKNQIVFNNDSMTEYASAEAETAGTFSYTRACAVARQLKRGKHTPSVFVDEVEQRTYIEPGYPGAQSSKVTSSIELSCVPYHGPRATVRPSKTGTIVGGES